MLCLFLLGLGILEKVSSLDAEKGAVNPTVDSPPVASEEDAQDVFPPQPESPHPKPRLPNRRILIIAVVILILAGAVAFGKISSHSGSALITANAVSNAKAVANGVGSSAAADKQSASAQNNDAAANPVDNAAALKEAHKVLLDEAKRQRIEVNDSTAENMIQRSLEAYKMPMEDFLKYLQDYNMTYDHYKESLKSELMISELVNRNVNLTDAKVSDSEVDAFIQAHKDELQDILSDKGALATLRSKVKSSLLQEKQAKLVLDYANSIK